VLAAMPDLPNSLGEWKASRKDPSRGFVPGR